MICSESCNLQPEGAPFDPGHPKNASETLCVGSEINRIPIPNVLEGSR